MHEKSAVISPSAGMVSLGDAYKQEYFPPLSKDLTGAVLGMQRNSHSKRECKKWCVVSE